MDLLVEFTYSRDYLSLFTNTWPDKPVNNAKVNLQLDPVIESSTLFGTLSLASIFGNLLYTETEMTFVLCRI